MATLVFASILTLALAWQQLVRPRTPALAQTGTRR